jgi:crotonobetainyl-CoA:carnitine CoA-transferase CaiB-like acyl-CoA transferase
MFSSLEGIKVVDFTQMIAGPYCSMWMGDMGADIVKIEHPGRGDLIRRSHPFTHGDSYPYLMLNRNKRSLSINLSKPEAKEILLKLIDQSDVVISSFRPGTLEKYGLGYETVKPRNPKVIYACVSGFGSTGPLRELGGYDLIAQAASGMMSVSGDPDGPPGRCGYPVLDVLAGSFALSSILAALRDRDRTGVGQVVDVSLVESGLACAVWQAARFFNSGEVAKSAGTGHPAMSPYQLFKASDGWFALAINSDEHWPEACRIMGLDELANDPRFATGSLRFKNQEVLIPMMEQRFLDDTVDHWMACFMEVDIPCGPVNTIDKAIENPHMNERGMVMNIDHPEAGPLRTLAPPMKSSQSQPRAHRAPPKIGEHNHSLMKSLGFSDAEIQQYEAKGVLGRSSR